MNYEQSERLIAILSSLVDSLGDTGGFEWTRLIPLPSAVIAAAALYYTALQFRNANIDRNTREEQRLEERSEDQNEQIQRVSLSYLPMGPRGAGAWHLSESTLKLIHPGVEFDVTISNDGRNPIKNVSLHVGGILPGPEPVAVFGRSYAVGNIPPGMKRNFPVMFSISNSNNSGETGEPLKIYWTSWDDKTYMTDTQGTREVYSKDVPPVASLLYQYVNGINAGTEDGSPGWYRKVHPS